MLNEVPLMYSVLGPRHIIEGLSFKCYLHSAFASVVLCSHHKALKTRDLSHSSFSLATAYVANQFLDGLNFS